MRRRANCRVVDLQQVKSEMHAAPQLRDQFSLRRAAIHGEGRPGPKRTVAVACLLVGLSTVCTGCVTLGVEGANITKDKLVHQANIEAAQNGDPLSQYKVGDSLCCSINEGAAFYNTQEAVRWLCLSARQGYGPAMLKVGRILSGDVVDGVRVARRIAHRAVGSTTNFTVAYGWLRAAERNGVPEAKDRANALWSKMSDEQRVASNAFQGSALPKACTWEEAGLSKSESTE